MLKPYIVLYIPGPEIKTDLISMLQNRLDDAVMEMISLQLSRNPVSKLLPDDVHVSMGLLASGASPGDLALGHFTIYTPDVSIRCKIVYVPVEYSVTSIRMVFLSQSLLEIS